VRMIGNPGGPTTEVVSVDGKITVTGFGAGSGADNDGVDVIQSTIKTTGLGNVTINGVAASSPGTGIGVRLQNHGRISATGIGNVVINGDGTGEVDIEWDDLTIQKAGGAYVFNGSTLSTGSLIALPGPYVGVINATALGITFQGVLDVEQGVVFTFNSST